MRAYLWLPSASAAAAALALVSACTANATGPTSRAAIPPVGSSSLHGRIAYSTRGGDVWVMNADGSGRRRITRSGRGIDFDPDFSPDGRRIVFRTSRGRHAPDIYGMGLEGARRRPDRLLLRGRRRPGPLSHGRRRLEPASAHPLPRRRRRRSMAADGRIVFSHFRGDEPLPHWYLIRPDGSGLRSLPQLYRAGDPIAWLP